MIESLTPSPFSRVVCAAIFAAVYLSTVAYAVDDGHVRTRAGQTLEGSVSWVDGRIRVQSGDSEAVDLRLDEVEEIHFSAAAAPAPASAPPITNVGHLPVLAEYFPDKEMKTLLLKR